MPTITQHRSFNAIFSISIAHCFAQKLCSTDFFSAMPISQQICLKLIYLCPDEYYYNYSLVTIEVFYWNTALSLYSYNTHKLKSGDNVCIYKVTCIHLQSYNWKKLTACACVLACVRARVRVCIRSSLHSVRFGKLLRCAHKRIVNLKEHETLQ